MDEVEPNDVVAGVVDVFQRMYQEAAAAIGAISDPDEAFKATEELDRQLQALHNDRMTRLKARQAVRIRSKHKLSLTGLAQRTNRSRAGAALYVRIDREATAEEAPCPSSTT